MAEATGFVTDIAAGKITIDLSQVQQAKDIFVRAISDMEAATETFSPALAKTERQVTASLKSIIRSANDMFNSVRTASAGVTVFGVNATRSVTRTKDTFRLLVGEEEKADKWMKQIRQSADDTHQAFIPLLEGMANMVPLLRNSNVEFQNLLNVSQQLAALDQGQGAAGAAFALREAFGGQGRSLAARFELPLSKVNEIIKENEGDMNGMLMALSAYLDELGVTADMMAEFGAQGHNAFSILKSDAEETAAVAFGGVNDQLNKMAMGFADVLRQARELDNGLLPILGTVTALVGSSQAINLAGAIPGVNIPGGQTIARAGVGAAALYGGAQLGAFAAREAGLAGTEGKSQNEVLQMAFDTFKKILFIAADSWSKLEVILTTAGYKIGNAFGIAGAAIQYGAAEVGNALDSLVNAITTGAASILDGFAGFLEGLEFSESIDLGFTKINLGFSLGDLPDDLRGMADDVRNLDSGLKTSDETMRELQETITGGIDLTDEQRQKVAELAEANREGTLSFGEWLGLIETTPSIFNDVKSKIMGAVEEMRAGADRVPVKTDVMQFSDEQIEAYGKFQEDLAQIQKDGTERLADENEQYQERRIEIQKQGDERLNDEDQRYQENRVNLIARGNEQINNENERYQERRISIIDQANERIANQEAQYAEQRSSIIENESIRRERAEQNLARSIQSIEQRSNDQIEQTIEDHNSKIVQMEVQRQQSMVDAQEKYEDQLAKLERDAKNKRQTALARFDAWGLFQANRDYEQRKDELEENLEDERGEIEDNYQKRLDLEIESQQDRLDAAQDAADKQIAQLRDNFNYQESIRAEDYALQLSELDSKNQQSIAKIQNQAAQELGSLDTKHAQSLAKIQNQNVQELASLDAKHMQTIASIRNETMAELGELQSKHNTQLAQIRYQTQMELQERNTAFQREFNLLVTHNGQMLLIQNAGLQNLERGLQAWYQRQAAQFGNMQQVTTSISNVTQRAGSMVSSALSSLRGIFPGGSGKLSRSGLAMVGAGEAIMGSNTVAAFESMMGRNFTQPALVGAMGGGGAQIGDISIEINVDGAQVGNDPRALAETITESVYEAVVDIMSQVR